MMQAKNTTDAATQYGLGIEAAQRGELRAGLLHLKAAIDLDVQCGDYWLAYCEALAACGENATALAVIHGARQRGFAGPALENLEGKIRGAADPPEWEILYRAAAKDHRENRLTIAVEEYRRVLALKPDFAEAHVNIANALLAQNDVESAITHFRQAIAMQPDFTEAHYSLGNASTVQAKDAVDAYRAAINARPEYASALYDLGLALEGADRAQEAIAAYRGAVKAKPDFAEAHVNLGVLLFASGALDDAIAAYDAAILARPRFLAAHHNRGTALRQKGLLTDAVAAYEKATAIEPRFAEAHHHLGNLLRQRGEVAAAIQRYRTALDIKPDFVEAICDLGYALIEADQIREGFSWLTRHAQLTNRGMTDPGPPHKQRHDEEQRAFLGPGKPGPLDALRLECGAQLSCSALNRNSDIRFIERQWRENIPQLVVIDDFLSQKALYALRQFCWGSTIWRESYAKGYLGAFPEHGVACPLLAQIAEELKRSYREIFRNHPLHQLWAFKYESRLGGIPLHADFAAVNVNFWITPDDANLDPDHGGLVIWDMPAPRDWNFDKYNNDPAAGRDFLANTGAHAITIPHRANRAVIFHSDLFHETDAIDFKDGYRNRRINLTLLYGRRGTE
jgi:tetratricopeptide (TPR) repeat protein